MSLPLQQNDFWTQEFLGNTTKEHAIALAVFIGLIIIFKIFKTIILHRLEKLAKKTKTEIDDAVIEVFKTIKPPFYIYLAFYIAIQTLNFTGLASRIITALLIIWIVFLLVKAAQIFIDVLFRKKLDEGERTTKSAIGAIKLIAKIILWSFGLLIVLSNLGVNITSLVAGLGVGGIAVALAVQNILSDLFSSFAIYFDKPFVVGDFIVIGEHKGTVEKIGIKTTRIRSLQGEEIVISNQELTSARIQNFKKMQKRRITFSIGVLYETPSEKLKKIPQMIKTIIDAVDKTEFDRAHFKEFGDFALIFEIVFYIESGDYTDYMNAQQEINLKINQAFAQENIEMAYPTQTINLIKSSS